MDTAQRGGQDWDARVGDALEEVGLDLEGGALDKVLGADKGAREGGEDQEEAREGGHREERTGGGGLGEGEGRR